MKRVGLMTTLMTLVTTPVGAAESGDLGERLKFSGTIEVEAAYTDSTDWGDDNSTSDIVLATAEIVLDVAIFENVGIHLVSLYKEGDVEVGVNEGYLELVNFSDTDFSTKLGKMYLPFGQLETNLVNDTLALGLVSPFEPLGFRESAALLSWSAGNMGLAGYVFMVMTMVTTNWMTGGSVLVLSPTSWTWDLTTSAMYPTAP